MNKILLQRVVTSDRDELRAIPKLLEEVRNRCPLDDAQFFNLVIALTEAVNNAIVHGNDNNPALTVRYVVSCTDRGVFCVVEDQGSGFDLDRIADPTDPVNLLSDGGRGIFLIRALMRDLQITPLERGTRVSFLCPLKSS